MSVYDINESREEARLKAYQNKNQTAKPLFVSSDKKVENIDKPDKNKVETSKDD